MCSVYAVTHSQGKQFTVPEERLRSLTFEIDLESPSLDENPYIQEIAEVVLLKNPDS